jgi:hypothetical protein
MESLKKMRHLAQELVVGEECEGDTSLPVQCVKTMKMKDDEAYFDTYSHFSIHHEMLSVSLKAVTVMYSQFNNGSDKSYDYDLESCSGQIKLLCKFYVCFGWGERDHFSQSSLEWYLN